MITRDSRETNSVPKLSSDERLIVFPERNNASTLEVNQPDVMKIGKGIYLVSKGTPIIQSQLQQIPHFRFRKVKEIPQIRSRDPETKGKKVFAVVWYRFESPTDSQKKKAQRLRLRSPCLKLRPGVMLFPHLRNKDRERYLKTKSDGIAIGSKEFSSAIHRLGAKVARWTRLELMNNASNEILFASLETMSKKEIESIELKFRNLRKAAKEQVRNPKKLRERYSELSTIYKNLSSKYRVIRLVWSFDLQRELKRVYNLMLKTKHTIQQ